MQQMMSFIHGGMKTGMALKFSSFNALIFGEGFSH